MPKSKYIAKSRVSGKRWVALLVAAVIFIAVIVSMIIGFGWGNRGAFGILSLLKDTYVNMDGVAAFGVWNAPDSSSDTAYISDVGVLRAASASADEGTAEDGEIISGDWSDDDRYDWESDYDWDPTKANVLIAFNDDGTISEVVYERTNGRGQIRQDSLGNATRSMFRAISLMSNTSATTSGGGGTKGIICRACLPITERTSAVTTNAYRR